MACCQMFRGAIHESLEGVLSVFVCILYGRYFACEHVWAAVCNVLLFVKKPICHPTSCCSRSQPSCLPFHLTFVHPFRSLCCLCSSALFTPSLPSYVFSTLSPAVISPLPHPLVHFFLAFRPFRSSALHWPPFVHLGSSNCTANNKKNP